MIKLDNFAIYLLAVSYEAVEVPLTDAANRVEVATRTVVFSEVPHESFVHIGRGEDQEGA